MKTLWSIIGYSAVALVVALCAPVRSEDVRNDAAIAEAVARTTMQTDGEPHVREADPRQQIELAQALTALSEHGGLVAKRRREPRCYYNCPPPVGSVTASPQVTHVTAGGLASVTLHWRWDQASTEAVSQHSCLWVSGGEENEAHLVQCERSGHTYATTVSWIGAGDYVFRVAPGNPKGPYTKPVASLFQLAQTIVVGAPP